jgi:hypothetical protein
LPAPAATGTLPATLTDQHGTLAEMRACITAVKALLAGQSVDFNGTPGRLGFASGRRIPVSWATMAAVLVLARLCEPASELHIAETWYRGMAVQTAKIMTLLILISSD